MPDWSQEPRENPVYRPPRIHGLLLAAIVPLVLLWLLTLRDPAFATDWAISLSTEEEIRALTAALQKGQGWPDRRPSSSTVLLHDQFVVPEDSGHRLCENMVIWVRRVSDDGERLVFERDVLETELKNFGTFRLTEDGAFQQTDELFLQKLPSEREGAVTVRVDMSTASDGDLVGWSLLQDSARQISEMVFFPATTLPVATARFKSFESERISYRVAVYNLETDQIWKSPNENSTSGDLEYVIRDLPAFPRGAYSPPRLYVEPHLRLDLHAKWMSNGTDGEWMFWDSWSQESVRADTILRLKFEQYDGSDVASKTLAGIDVTEEQLKALYYYSQAAETLPELSHLSFETKVAIGDAPTSSRAYLFAALAHSAGFDVRLGYARPRDMGPVAQEFPTLRQLPTILVEAPWKGGRWLVPDCLVCPFGAVPPELWGRSAFVPRYEAKHQKDLILDRMGVRQGGPSRIQKQWLRTELQSRMFYEWVTLPGKEQDIAGSLVETIRFFPDKGVAKLELNVSGFDPLAVSAHEGSDPSTVVSQWSAARYEEVAVSEASFASTAEVDRDSELRILAQLADLPEPRIEGDTWVLPAELIYGIPTFAHWTGPEHGLFHVERATERTQYWRCTFPNGWGDDFVPLFERIDNAQFSWSCLVRAEGAELVIERRVALRAGMTDPQRAFGFDNAIAEVNAIERQPLRIRKRARGDPNTGP